MERFHYEIQQKIPIKLWSKLIGNRITTRDIALRKIKIDDYTNGESGFNWTIDRIKPIYKGGNKSIGRECNSSKIEGVNIQW